jgi:hypothetical protein
MFRRLTVTAAAVLITATLIAGTATTSDAAPRGPHPCKNGR